MPVIGLTGGIASGKSTASSFLRTTGAVVVDADELSRQVTMPGTEGLAAIADAFGATVLQTDGSLSREALGRIVFDNPEARRRLESIVHPLIAMASADAIARGMQESDVVFYDAALLFETGQWKNFAETWLIAVDPDVQMARILQRDGLSEEEATARVTAQLPLARKAELATRVFWNNGTVDELNAQLSDALAQLRNSDGDTGQAGH